MDIMEIFVKIFVWLPVLVSFIRIFQLKSKKTASRFEWFSTIIFILTLIAVAILTMSIDY